ncbi:MAG: hypothetical protein H7A24_03055 [Leptospiraceae bacterium]|nr:hypothetical protein [Leptospiraceae bacterium]
MTSIENTYTSSIEVAIMENSTEKIVPFKIADPGIRFLALENHLRFYEILLYTIIELMVTLLIAVVVRILLI